VMRIGLRVRFSCVRFSELKGGLLSSIFPSYQTITYVGRSPSFVLFGGAVNVEGTTDYRLGNIGDYSRTNEDAFHPSTAAL
jgi:hypothetical protein